MHRLALLVLPAALLLNACGDNADVVAGRPSTTVSGISHPTGADDIVVQVNVAGGFVPVEVAFGSVPQLTIYGDGTVLRPGAVIAIYPGPMVSPMFRSTLSEEGLQNVLEAATAAGLAQTPPSYESPATSNLADAPTTEVILDAGGGRWVHRAYGLGEAQLDTPARTALSDFVTAVSSLETLAGPGTLTGEEPYQPTQLRIRASANPQPPTDVQPTVMPWPDDSVDLTAAKQCAVVRGATVKVLEEANQLTWFTQGGTTYSLMARPVLPGETGC